MVTHSLDEFIKLPPDPTPFHCYPLLPKNGMLLMFAPTKYMKSYLALNMAYALAEGLPIFNIWPVKGGPKRVLVIEQECGQDEAQKRARELHAYRAGQWAGDNLWLVSKDLDCAIDSDEGMELIEKHVEIAKPQIIVLDPFSWFHSRPGNDNDEMKRLVRKLLQWQQKRDLASILTHHTTKRSEFRGGDGMDINSIKGASALAEAASTVIGLSRPTSSNTLIRLDLTLRHAENPRPVKLQFHKEGGIFETLP